MSKNELVNKAETRSIDRKKRLIEEPIDLEFISIDPRHPKFLVDTLRDKLPAEENDFVKLGDKGSGISTGHIAGRVADGKTHLLKIAKLDPDAVDLEAEYQKILDRRDFITEFVYGRIYSRILYDAAPKINLAKSSDRENIYLTSKFFDDFKTLTELTGAKGNASINSDNPVLQRVEGFEKIIAACVLGGEADFHASNIGVVPSVNEDGTPKLNEKGEQIWSAVKIDHGRSNQTEGTEDQIRLGLLKEIEVLGYGEIKLNLNKFREHLEQMTKISDEEIANFVARDIAELKKAGMNFDISLTHPELLDGDSSSSHSHSDASSQTIKPLTEEGKLSKISDQAARDFFLANFKKRRDVASKLVETLEIIERIEPVPKNWKDGQWLKDIGGRDPIAWAVENGKNIVLLRDSEGTPTRTQSPVDWAKANGKRIEGKDPSEWAAQKSSETEKFTVERSDKIEKMRQMLGSSGKRELPPIQVNKKGPMQARRR